MHKSRSSMTLPLSLPSHTNYISAGSASSSNNNNGNNNNTSNTSTNIMNSNSTSAHSLNSSIIGIHNSTSPKKPPISSSGSLRSLTGGVSVSSSSSGVSSNLITLKNQKKVAK